MPSLFSMAKIVIRSQLSQTVRNTKMQLLFVVGSLGVFGILLLAWITTAGHERIYLSDRKFQKLSLDVQCDLTLHEGKQPICTPYYDKYDENSLTTTSVFFDILGGGSSFDKSESGTESTTSFVTLLGNLMMNGLPFAGLDDYVFMSDLVNQKMEPSTLQTLDASPLIGRKFSNFLNVRKNEIRLVPNNCWTQNFVKYLQQTSSVVQSLSVQIFSTMDEAIAHKSNAWVVVEILPDATDPTACPFLPDTLGLKPDKRKKISISSPLVTLRFHPASIPDTRNLMWSQRKQGGGSPTTLQSGQLLYFTSGFLTIQYEIQNFFSVCQLGGIPILREKSMARLHANATQLNSRRGGSKNSGASVSSFSFLNDYIASALLESTSVEHLLEHLVNISTMDIPQPSISVPLYDRAYPTRGYAKDLFWHNLGQILSVALIMYFSVPSAMTAKEFTRDALTGPFDSILTLPGMTMKVLCTAYVTTSWVISTLPFWLILGFCSIILKFTSPWIPAISLLLMSMSLGSMAVVISSFTKNIETAVVLVPTTVFLMTLPGIVYYDLAFDVQRTVLIECILCVLPPSACVLILRSVCTMEALSSPLLLSTTSLVSHVPLFVHVGILTMDVVLFYALAVLCTDYQFQLQVKLHITQQDVMRNNFFSWSRKSVGGERDSFCRGIFALVTGIWQYIMTSNRGRTSSTDCELSGTVDTHTHEHQHWLHHQQSQYYQHETAHYAPSGCGSKPKPTVGLVVSDVSKSFISTEKECQIEVLRHIHAHLHAGSVTTLLGSNGGGKTTLLRILGGFDASHDGNVYYVKKQEQQQEGRCRRTVGWCSQQDALYEYLTIREHLELFCTLLTEAEVSLAALAPAPVNSPTPPSSPSQCPAQVDVPEGITSLLTSLDLLEHQDKFPSALSGGMKRRLSLALASLGSPLILLLDEPTSGCDSYTREMVRQDILSRKESCSVLISTHHIDDVEVISDRVWFLNDHSLVYDGPLASLKLSLRGDNNSEDEYEGDGNWEECSNSQLDYVDFSTSNAVVKGLFLAQFRQVSRFHTGSTSGTSTDIWSGPALSDWKAKEEEEIGCSSLRSSNSSWGVSLRGPGVKVAFRQFLKELEGRGVLDWSVSSPNVYNALSRMYAPPPLAKLNEEEKEENRSSGGVGLFERMNPTVGSTATARTSYAYLDVFSKSLFVSQKMKAIISMRLAEIKLKKKHFIFSSIVLPFCMMLMLVFYCRDIRYPKLELTSASIGGIGEILVSYGRPASSTEEHNPLTVIDGPKSLQHILGKSFTWLGYDVKSNAMFDMLYKEYYMHAEGRWSSFVLDDTVEQWLSSSVRITDRSFEGGLTMTEAVSTLQVLKSHVCNASQPEVEREGGHDEVLMDQKEILLQVKTAFERHRSKSDGNVGDETANITDFCQFIVGMEINLIQNTSHGVVPKGNRATNTSAVKLQVSQGLNAKLTMLSNMTFFHDTPMFLKEIVPHIYSSREQSCPAEPTNNHLVADDLHNQLLENKSDVLDSDAPHSSSPKTSTTAHAPPVYHLFSHPLDDSSSKMKAVSPAFIQRGYLGAVIIIMYILITSTTVLKFITQSRKHGWKTQLHLSGVSPFEYWISNFLVDFGVLFVSFLAIFTAISIGGPPISSFYLDSKSEYANIFLFSLCSFAGASVSVNYFFAFLSVDPVSSQLLALFSSLCGGLFLRLFIALHAHVEPYESLHTWCLWLSPPYAFSSNMYDLFVQYVRHFSPKVSTVLAVEVSLFPPLVAMGCQTVVYLCLTIVADTYYYRVVSLLHRWSKHLAVFIAGCRANTNWRAISRTPSISLRSTVSRYIALLQSQHNNSNDKYGGGSMDKYFQQQQRGENYGSLLFDEEMALLSSEPSIEHHTDASDIPSTKSFSTLERSTSFLSEHSCCEDDKVEKNSNTIVNSRDLDICYKTGVFSHTRPVIKQLSVHIKKAERVALMGVNGGGKSTLYRAMTNTDMLPLAGSLSLDHLDSVRDHWGIGAANVVGYVPQEGGLLEFMTVQDAVHLFLEIRKTTILSISATASSTTLLEAQAQQMKKQMYKILPKRYFPYYIFTLSGGNKQKLAVLLSNIFEPSLLLLDEPTSGVDPAAASELIRYLSCLPRSQAIIFASHRMEECVVICRRVLLLFEGRLEFDGPITEFSKVTDLFYQVDIEIEITSTDNVSACNSNAFGMSTFIDVFLQRLQQAVAINQSGDDVRNKKNLVERIVRYSDALVRLTFEKTKCPLSDMWSALVQWDPNVTMSMKKEQHEASSYHHRQQTLQHVPAAGICSIVIKSLSLRKMSMEEIFAAMVDAARLDSNKSSSTK